MCIDISSLGTGVCASWKPELRLAAWSAAVVLLAYPHCQLAAQSADADTRTFDAASVKPAKGGVNRDTKFVHIRINPVSLSVGEATLRGLIAEAYEVNQYQIVDAPDWFDTEFFNVNGRTASATSSTQLRMMLRQLLADRFKFTFHHETRLLPVYALRAKKAAASPAHTTEKERSPGAGFKPMHFKDAAALCKMLSLFASDLPVLDETGAPKDRDFSVDLTAYMQVADLRAHKPPGLILLEAVEDQLGFKLVSVKAPVDTFVVDRAERPSEN
jgi:uncharacterized protein (TIGR03435 family)